MDFILGTVRAVCLCGGDDGDAVVDVDIDGNVVGRWFDVGARVLFPVWLFLPRRSIISIHYYLHYYSDIFILLILLSCGESQDIHQVIRPHRLSPSIPYTKPHHHSSHKGLLWQHHTLPFASTPMADGAVGHRESLIRRLLDAVCLQSILFFVACPQVYYYI
jgi:hypothetical protein